LPTYGYECNACKEQFEVFQRITEDALATHDGCGGELRRLLYPVGIVFKGSGFYVNDYAKKSSNGSEAKPDAKAEAKSDASEVKSEAKMESKSESKSESKTESKSEATTTKTD
jgi:putative FmdB family regulatory protein